MRERILAGILGFLGGLFLVIQGIVQFLVDVVHLALGRGFGNEGAGVFGILPAVLGVLVWLFTAVGASSARSTSLTGGVVLVVLAVVAAVFGNVPGAILWVLGFLFTLLAGVVFLVTHGRSY